MKSIKLVFALFLSVLVFSQSVFAASGSANVSNVISLGGNGISSNDPSANASAFSLPIGSLSNTVLLVAGTTVTGGANFLYGLYSASSPTTSTQYQVPAGKTLYIIGNWYYSSGANAAIQFGYGTAALAAEDTNVDPTGVVTYGHPATAFKSGTRATVAQTYHYLPGIMSFPALSYPFVKYSANGGDFSVILQGLLL